MKEINEPNIEFEGKKFEFLFYFGDGAIYGHGSVRLIVDPDGSFYGTYNLADKKGVTCIF